MLQLLTLATERVRGKTSYMMFSGMHTSTATEYDLVLCNY